MKPSEIDYQTRWWKACARAREARELSEQFFSRMSKAEAELSLLREVMWEVLLRVAESPRRPPYRKSEVYFMITSALQHTTPIDVRRRLLHLVQPEDDTTRNAPVS